MKEVPYEVKHWNWGAFMFNITWGLGNKTYLPLLTLIPIFNIVWIFVVGAKGNEWAWKNGDYEDVKTFLKVQETWNRAGIWQIILAVIGVLIYIVALALMVAAFNPSQTY
ncbi:ribonuclease G [Lacticaseibacillus pabuli]|uniref:Ribonuclease G n=1 Tax=Lacticaseibacillus pabuli TaxID=3025672 RepID=A0ABY7WSI2_9LACO|nr:ribonuclease G [Lacticaseibacillus sp. KACC 23028]WDF83086.1 ribonuclease G [Lacticaseibacillus sp. KACC 23028]